MRTTNSSAATMYQHSQVTNADPVQLIILLHNGALSRISQGRQRLQEKDLLQAGLAVSKALAIVSELRNSLNMEAGGDIARNLDRLYAYLHELLVKSMRENRPEPLDEATRLLNEMRTGWGEVATVVAATVEKNHAATTAPPAQTSETRDAGRFQLKA